ncbi:hypothetical protein Rhopal_007860-T1 [Rhodotorula paludigena]|uniref:Uncharacterized protein n=1 Tax=Rhodotorula paludigena TaxID=86838 RepID=A0AAV5GWU8_9BASI|nr:hypothetical protein Rhopal_007860-T1 [Rhodotorula paludigena]
MTDDEGHFYNSCYKIADRGLVEQAKAFIAMLHEQEKLEYEKKDLYPWRVRYQAFKENQKNAQAVNEVFRLRNRQAELEEAEAMFQQVEDGEPVAVPEKSLARRTHPLLSRYGFRQRLRYFGSY